MSLLLDPMQGSKVIIEGKKQKSGKTLLGASMSTDYAYYDPKVIIYGSIPVEHPNYIQKDKITKKDFDKQKRYIVFVDEADLDYPWQDAHYNEGFWAFWGRGSSHNKCAVVITIQKEYAQMRSLQRTCHILVYRTIFNGNTGLPFQVIGDLLYSEYGFRDEFSLNIENIIGRYDPYDNQDNKIDFNSWRAKRIREEKSTTTSTVSTLHGGQLRAVKKALNELISVHGNISAAARKTGISRNFFYDIVGRKE